MAVRLGELADFYDPRMFLSIRGKEYAIPAHSAALALWVVQIAALRGIGDDPTEEQVQELAAKAEEMPDLPDPDMSWRDHMLSPGVVAKMVEDGVSDDEIKFVAQTAFFRILGGDDLAQAYYAAGGDPNRVRPPSNRAARRAQARATGGGNAAAATTTPPPASASGTNSPKRSRPRRRRGRNAR